MNKTKANMKRLLKDKRAVSPIIATLVLIVVSVIGAASVGTIMGTFSSDVAEDASTGEVITMSSTEILVAGSTTVQPVSELLAKAYMDEHQGVKVTVQGGGSGAGVASVGMGIVDIGAASRDMKGAEKDKYPDLKKHQIGGSAVVLIANDNVPVFNIDREQLITAYVDNDPDAITDADITTLYQRAEASGTEETFAKWLGMSEDDINAIIEGKTGNAGVLAAVQDTENSLGFVDYGYADGADDIVILGIVDIGGSGNTYEHADVTGKNIKKELKNEDGNSYVTKLTRPLNYFTNGDPSSLENSYITFARSPGATTYFHEIGYFSITEFA